MRDNKINFLIFIFLAILTLFTERFSLYPGVPLELGNYKYLVSLLFVGIGIILLRGKKPKE
ncbi:MAG: hypothetical protein ACI9RG_000548 [Sulfurimonas sp.]|jgi:hypothetical protein